ncbi:MAG: phospholipid/cholesterol/gamma-HCH transport system ATP-binding protein [Phycisphaerales bacterium]|jgi:phospholipid/cholesterol/gamma-HCH transport system ATP-binding protein
MPAPSDDDIAIRCRGVVMRFGDQTVLHGVDLDIRRGETIAIFGGSGSGKSTLLRTIIGSHVPAEGSIEILGHDICQANDKTLNEVRKQFGILFQSGALFNSMTLAENVALPLREHTDLDPETIDIMVKIKLELVGLREHADKLPDQISGGMKKRAGLARALALDPKILFYDEPSAGLDPVTSAQIDQLIIALSKQLGVTSVVVTHEMDSAFAIADRMAMLDKGRMIKIADRVWWEQTRDAEPEHVAQMTQDELLIRQFLRGDPDGPLTERRSTDEYEIDLFGPVSGRVTSMPSVEPTRG